MAKIPLTLNAEESFQIVIFENVYNLRQLWNRRGFWTLDISDKDNNPIILSVKLVTGITLLKQYPQVGFDLKSDSLLADPSRNDLIDFEFNVINKNV